MNRLLATAVAVMMIVGCAKVSEFPLGRRGTDCVRISTVDMNSFRAWIKFSPLKAELQKELDLPISIASDWNAEWIKIHLADREDYYHLLYLDPVQFARVSETVSLVPLAVRKNLRGADREVGLIVVPKNSPIKSIIELAGKRFTFGPYDSAYMFYNVLELLAEHKVRTGMLKAARYAKDNLGVVQELLVFRATDAGVVTKTWWKTTTDRTLDQSKLLRDELRIIGQTRPMPEYIWAATGAMSKDRQDRVRNVLIGTITGKPAVLKPFRAGGFVKADVKTVGALVNRIKRIKDIPSRPLLPVP